MKFLYENFLQFYLLALTSITQHKNKDTNISNSLDVKDKFKENKEDEVDTRKIGMVG
ncbi:hypothetical protein [Spiroplasma endosymbiont of Thecophora atra]|uniref:hypothetical protein n=1 Tax=Spiroplasma endosymbiont of Thecophora atra TaxID=3066294 RepID=UPI0030D169F7